MINWRLEEIPIKSLKNHPKNPRQINKESSERLSEAMDRFGLIDKPIVNTDNTIIGGHQRIKILKNKKVKTVQCWVPDVELSEKELDELCIGLNLHQGTWDWDTLANQWETLDLLEYGFSEEKLLGTCKEADEILDEIDKENQGSGKKQKLCPNCGHEF